MRTTTWTALLVVLVAAALATRLPKLGLRPMHTDEAVHACKFDILLQTGRYRYDPSEYHGPTLYYLTLPIAWLSGAQSFAEMNAATFRLVPVLFGVGLVALLVLVGDGLGRPAALCAGLLTVLSPALSFYGRYYIQETLLVFFTFLALAAGWRYVRSGRAGWALLCGAAVGLMHATKETSIIVFGALAVALAVSGRRARIGRRVGAPVAAALIAVAISALLYSGFLTNPAGPLDAVRSYATYFDRAGGHGLHDHPWHYYLRMLALTHYVPGPWWSEGLILALAAIGIGVALRDRGLDGGDPRLLRFLAIYTLVLTGIYSAIPYKTPWCMLGFLHGMVLLAGVGAVAWLRWLRWRWLRVAGGLLLLALAGQLGAQAFRANFRFYADYRNPYVYAHPRIDVVRLARRVQELAEVHPDGRQMLVRVIAPDPWPLPWYLRRLKRVGYWEQVPEQADAPVIIAAAELQAQLDQRLRDQYQVNAYGLRQPDVVLWLYVRGGLWDEYVRRRLSVPHQPGSAPAP